MLIHSCFDQITDQSYFRTLVFTGNTVRTQYHSIIGITKIISLLRLLLKFNNQLTKH